MYVVNILDAYTRATHAEVSEGIHWYDNTRALATEWANGDVWKGAGVIAAYSPKTPWWRNLELAEDSLATGIAHPAIFTDKVAAILAGAPVLPTLNGPKLTAFASAIADPNSSLVTVDSHAYSIAVGYWVPTNKVPKLRGRRYSEFSAAYTEAANLTGHSVSELQAITWVSWRNRHPNKAARKGDIVQSLALSS